MALTLNTKETAIEAPGGRPWIKCWPHDVGGLGTFVTAFLALTMLWTLVGLAIVAWFEPSALGEAEADLARHLEGARTEWRNDLATWGSFPSNTPVKVGLMVVLGVGLPRIFKRWHDWAFLLGALLLEVSVYGASGYLVGRPRPPVERLAHAPTESWPSGHVAAALTFYVGLAIIVAWHTDNRLARLTARAGAGTIVLVMAVSRLYLGMHYVSDVIGGLVLGGVSLAVTIRIVRRSLARKADGESWPAQARRLDLTSSTDRGGTDIS